MLTRKSQQLAKLRFSFNPVGIKYNAVVLLTFNVGFKLRDMKVGQQPTFIFVLRNKACFFPMFLCFLHDNCYYNLDMI